MHVGVHTPIATVTTQPANSHRQSQRRRDSEDIQTKTAAALATTKPAQSVVRTLRFSSAPASPVRSRQPQTARPQPILSPGGFDPESLHRTPTHSNESQSTPTSPLPLNSDMSKLRAINGKLISPVKPKRAANNKENSDKPRNILVGNPAPPPPVTAMSAQCKPDADGFIPPSPLKRSNSTSGTGTGTGSAPHTPKRGTTTTAKRTGPPTELKSTSASNLPSRPGSISTTAKSRPSPLASPLASPKPGLSRTGSLSSSRPSSRPGSRFASPAQSPAQSPGPSPRLSRTRSSSNATAAPTSVTAAANRVLSPRQIKPAAAQPTATTLAVPTPAPVVSGSAVSPMSFLAAALPPTPCAPVSTTDASVSHNTPVATVTGHDTSLDAASIAVLLTPTPQTASTDTATPTPIATATATGSDDANKQKALATEAMRSLFGRRRSDVAQVELGHRLIAIDKRILNGTCTEEGDEDGEDGPTDSAGADATANTGSTDSGAAGAVGGGAPTPRKLRLQSTVDRQARLLAEKESRIADLDSKYVEAHNKLEALTIRCDEQQKLIRDSESVISELKSTIEKDEAALSDITQQTKLYTDIAATNTAQKQIIEQLKSEAKKSAEENKKLRHAVRALQARRQSEQPAGPIIGFAPNQSIASGSASVNAAAPAPVIIGMSWRVHQILSGTCTPQLALDWNAVNESRSVQPKEWLHPSFEVDFV